MKIFPYRVSAGSRRLKLLRRVIVCAALPVMLWLGRCAFQPAVEAARDFIISGSFDRAIYAFYDGLLRDGSIAEAVLAFDASLT